MDVLGEEMINFWRALNANSVRYIMVGGLATRFHGYNRATDDLDIWIEDTLLNRQNLRYTFVELKYGDFESLETMQFVPGWTTFYAAGVELDIMTSMKGLEDETFANCYEMASVSNLDGVLVPFLHINHLISNKKAVNRPKDQMDVIHLEKIKEIRASDKK
jgi:hypothetical protein